MAKTKGSRKKPVRGDRKMKYGRKFDCPEGKRENQTFLTSTSAKKFRESGEFSVQADESLEYVMLSFNKVFGELAEKIKCKTCDGDISFSRKKVRGLGFQLEVMCKCTDPVNIDSCNKVGINFEINRKYVFVMRLLGVGIHGLQLFASMMDLNQNFSKHYYYRCLDNIKIAVDSVTNNALKKAANEEKNFNKEHDLPENQLVVSGDGTWQTRGFSSLLGVSTLIGKYSSKVLDFFVSNKVCKVCEVMKAKSNASDFLIWFETDHKEECPVNYEGSSGGMEAQAVIAMFRRSLERYKVRYGHYIGDGDSKTFAQLSENKPYGNNLIVQKLECINHVNKRMFKQLTEAKKNITQFKKVKAKEQKELEEKIKKEVDEPPNKKRRSNEKKKPDVPKTAELTGKLIKSMSLFYGIAIRNNPNSVQNMKKDIWAIYDHQISTDNQPRHENCSGDWCKYLKAEKAKEKFVHPPALSQLVQQYVKPVFTNLTRDDLLIRCLGKNTQNNNESFNNILWSMAPKHTLSGIDVVTISAGIAACLFNEGKSPLLKMMEVMGITVGLSAFNFCSAQDDFRLKRAEKRNSNTSKEARIQNKKKRQDQEEAFQQAYGLLYGAGIDDS